MFIAILSLVAAIIGSIPHLSIRAVYADEPSRKLIRVGGREMERKIIARTAPEYPAQAVVKRIEGTVRLQVVVDIDGAPRQLHPGHVGTSAASEGCSGRCS